MDAPRLVTIVRCPRCGATDAGADEARSYYELTYMRCNGCGEGGLVDEWQIKDEWNVEIELAADATGLPSHVAPLKPPT
jgi:DNA-directed RNA polymerase subunit RPC12/RpoP